MYIHVWQKLDRVLKYYGIKGNSLFRILVNLAEILKNIKRPNSGLQFKCHGRVSLNVSKQMHGDR